MELYLDAQIIFSMVSQPQKRSKLRSTKKCPSKFTQVNWHQFHFCVLYGYKKVKRSILPYVQYIQMKVNVEALLNALHFSYCNREELPCSYEQTAIWCCSYKLWYRTMYDRNAFLSCLLQVRKDNSAGNWVEIGKKLLTCDVDRSAFRSALLNAKLIFEGSRAMVFS